MWPTLLSVLFSLSLSLSVVNFGVLCSRIAVYVAAAGATFMGRAWRGASFACSLANFRFVEKTVKHACLEKFASFTFCWPDEHTHTQRAATSRHRKLQHAIRGIRVVEMTQKIEKAVNRPSNYELLMAKLNNKLKLLLFQRLHLAKNITLKTIQKNLDKEIEHIHIKLKVKYDFIFLFSAFPSNKVCTGIIFDRWWRKELVQQMYFLFFFLFLSSIPLFLSLIMKD